MKLELHFSEQEMREFLKQHWWFSMEVDAYKQYSQHYLQS